MSFVEQTQHVIEQSSSWVRSQRWFGEKARVLQSFRASHIMEVELPRTRGALAIVECHFDEGLTEQYFLPLAGLPQQLSADTTRLTLPLGGMRDAFSEPDFLTWLLDGFVSNRVIDDEIQWRWRRFDEAETDLTTIQTERAEVMGGEQSNTSVLYDDRVIMKAFRRMQVGMNPDIEVGEFLASKTQFAHAPRMIGVIEATIKSEPYLIASLQNYVANRGDGWQWLRNQLAHLSADDAHRLLEVIDHLATLTAEMHIALASGHDNPAFTPEQISAELVDRGTRRLLSDVDTIIALLLQRNLVAPDQAVVLADRLGKVAHGYSALGASARIRVHGDYHLGQVLRTVDESFAVIDFEGEPSRPIEERRDKHSALKDVTGMVRSLDYAVASLRRESSSEEHRDDLSTWGERARSTFISSYRRKVLAEQPALLPVQDDRFNAALAALELEKALYEVHYELNNRPDWVSIPLDALRRIGG